MPSVGPHLQYSGFTAYLYVRITTLLSVYDKVFIFYFMFFQASDSGDTHSLFVDIINNPYITCSNLLYLITVRHSVAAEE